MRRLSCWSCGYPRSSFPSRTPPFRTPLLLPSRCCHHPHGCTGWCEGEGKQDGSACERCVLLCIVVVSVLLAFVFRADAVLQRRTARGGSGDDGVRGALTDSRSHTRPSLVVLSLHCTRCSASVLSPSSSAAIPFNLPSASAALPFYREAAQPPLSFPAPLPSCLGASSPHPPPLPPSPPPRPLSLSSRPAATVVTRAVRLRSHMPPPRLSHGQRRRRQPRHPRHPQFPPPPPLLRPRCPVSLPLPLPLPPSSPLALRCLRRLPPLLLLLPRPHLRLRLHLPPPLPLPPRLCTTW